MPRNRPDITDAQRDAMVRAAIDLMRAGASLNEASTQAAAPYGVSPQVVLRRADKIGTPLSQYTAEAAAIRAKPAQQARKQYQAADLRVLQHRLTAHVEAMLDAVDEAASNGKDAMELAPAVLRTSLLLTRVAVIDERLDRRLVPTEAAPSEDDDDAEALADIARARKEFEVIQGGLGA